MSGLRPLSLLTIHFATKIAGLRPFFTNHKLTNDHQGQQMATNGNQGQKLTIKFPKNQ
jgi:hypothetical protein